MSDTCQNCPSTGRTRHVKEKKGRTSFLGNCLKKASRVPSYRNAPASQATPIGFMYHACAVSWRLSNADCWQPLPPGNALWGSSGIHAGFSASPLAMQLLPCAPPLAITSKPSSIISENWSFNLQHRFSSSPKVHKAILQYFRIGHHSTQIIARADKKLRITF